MKFHEYSPLFEEEGFPVAGAVAWRSVRSEYSRHASRYEEWIRAKKHGDMGYLERGLERRMNPELVFPGLQSVIAVLKPYSPHRVGTEELRYARYLNGPDYHDDLKTGLTRAMERLCSASGVPAGAKFKICVDTSAVLERTWAELCGLGWIGKNTLLIHPKLGSYTFVGVVFTDLPFVDAPSPLKDYCGNCDRCLKACPTEALRVHDLDSRKCISYLTIEKRGPWVEALPTAGYLAGCDLCQEACPYNTKPEKYTKRLEPVPVLELDRLRLEQETEEDYRKRIEGSALSRVKFQDFKRNLASTRDQDQAERAP